MLAKPNQLILTGSKHISEKVRLIMDLNNMVIQPLHIGKDIEKVLVKLHAKMDLIMPSLLVENSTKNKQKKTKNDFIM